MLVVIKTFQYQQQVTKDNAKQLETQRFNDLFFELVSIYNREVKALSESISISYVSKGEKSPILEQTIQYESKEFFDYAKKELQEKFVSTTSFGKNRRIALNLYMLYYTENKSKLSGYYRILYRIYDLIDNASIDEDAKKNYLKIIRAQLSESELFFLRYNAMSYYGYNFIDYLNKYHVLKHLPAFDMLEFKDWWSDLDELEIMGMNIVADNFAKILRDLLKKKTGYISNGKWQIHKYTYIIRVTNSNEAQVTIIINNQRDNNTHEFKALDKFSNIKIQQLLDCFIKEVFLYSNFERYNKFYETFSVPIKIANKKTIISSGIRSKNGEPLTIEYTF